MDEFSWSFLVAIRPLAEETSDPGNKPLLHNMQTQRYVAVVCFQFPDYRLAHWCWWQGRSEYSKEELTSDVVGVIRHLGYEKCALVGHGTYLLHLTP